VRDLRYREKGVPTGRPCCLAHAFPPRVVAPMLLGGAGVVNEQGSAAVGSDPSPRPSIESRAAKRGV
jgi:hypothetical protein